MILVSCTVKYGFVVKAYPDDADFMLVTHAL